MRMETTRFGYSRISEPRVSKDGYPLPLVRLVSTMVHADKPIRHQHTVTFMFASWGQLVDHDVSLTAETKDPVTRKDILCCENQRHPNCLPIEVPPDDPFFSKQPFKKRCINFLRSLNGIRFGCKLGK
ncbi:hypothetical protein O3M35_008894 [Rhynocoris fuscipes]|uniref:Peroxidase n=1 Tax=Rhynocoris fuscipes TaxID=488301 RepID=A0AAW1D8M6_9HEMI